MSLFTELQDRLRKEILFIDGAMGTVIQQYKLTEDDYRGTRFPSPLKPLKGNNELLSLTRPEVILEIHRNYLEAGADIIETNTFNANRVSQADYGLEHLSEELNLAAAKLAVQARDEHFKKTGRRIYVAGAIGPTNKTASLSPEVADPAFRAVNFNELVTAYEEQARALLKGGVDFLLPETVFDTLNLKACLFAIDQIQSERTERIPIFVSVTITDQSGRTLTGQTVEAFWNSIRHCRPLIVGMNCALGPEQMRPWLLELSRVADCFIGCYPNAGLPNPLSPTGYDETPERMAGILKGYAEEGLLNLVGGCCGTTPAHIRGISQTLKGIAPRPLSRPAAACRLSGLEPLNIPPVGEKPFYLIGERTNVTGSPKFAALIKAGEFEKAVEVARQQVASGANLLDVNFDEGMLDSVSCMRTFLNWLAAEPDVARVPFVIDSSKFSVLEAGLQCIQGKPIVNSLSLKDGEKDFLAKARLCRRYGAAIVVMAFDEKGQAATLEDKVRICRRAYEMLVRELDFDPCDIIFDPNVLAIGTGIEEHAEYGLAFIEAVRRIKTECPGALTSGGVSNLSFSFRGQNRIREAMHSVFLNHAIKAGLDMAIVNAGMLEVVTEIEPRLRDLVEDLILNRDPHASEKLIELAETLKVDKAREVVADSWRDRPVRERLSHALVKGIDAHVEADVDEILAELSDPLAIIEGPLMDGMKIVGELFGQGRMFLPQVVKSARVMKKAVARLEPLLLAQKKEAKSTGTIVLATMKGDVHDIGKNIVGVVLACNGYKVIDLGVMVTLDKILAAIEEHRPMAVGFSGLITPSLDEMIFNVKEMKKLGLKLPILIGGATTSRVHTAVKIAPHYDGPLVHVNDASLVVEACRGVTGPEGEAQWRKLREENEDIRRSFESRQQGGADLIPLAAAREKRFRWTAAGAKLETPSRTGVFEIDSPLEDVIPFIDWSPFFWAWGMKGVFPELFAKPESGPQARLIWDEAQALLKAWAEAGALKMKTVVGLWPAASENEDVVVFEGDREIERFRFLRQQREKEAVGNHLCLADFIAPKGTAGDWMGAFAVTVGREIEDLAAEADRRNEIDRGILIKAVGDRLAEALAERAHKRVRELFPFGRAENLTTQNLIEEKYRGIRPAPGYPACPDHVHKRAIWRLLSVEEKTGARLTENLGMFPASSVSGFYFFHPESRYFHVGPVGDDQVRSLALQRGGEPADIRRFLGGLGL